MKFQKKQSLIQQIVSRENQLRKEITKLDQQVGMANDAEDEEMRAIGADVIWKAWVGRSKNALNLELAQVLAQKEAIIGQVRREFGKVQSVQNLVKAERKYSSKRKLDKQLNDAANFHIFRK